MSNSESREVDLIKDPGLPAHVHRRTDTDPVAAKRAERQVAILFSLSALGTLLLIYSFIFVSESCSGRSFVNTGGSRRSFGAGGHDAVGHPRYQPGRNNLHGEANCWLKQVMENL